MKKVIVVFALSTIFFAGCGNSQEKRAQRMIKAHLKETLDDPSSYKPVSFGTLDTSYVYNLTTDTERIDGWEMTHKFRAKNKAGAVVLMEETFFFDDDMQLEDI